MNKLIVVVFTVFLISGCGLCLPGNKLQTVTHLPSLPQDIKTPTCSYQFSYDADVWIARAFSHYRIGDRCEREFTDVLKESGYCASVEQGSQSDLNFEANLSMSTDLSGWTIAEDFFSILTYTATPNVKTNTIAATVKVTAREGKEHYYKLEDSFTVVAWLPLIVVPGTCDSWGVDVPGAARRNIWRNLLLTMYQDGIYSKNELEKR